MTFSGKLPSGRSPDANEMLQLADCHIDRQELAEKRWCEVNPLEIDGLL